MPIYEYTCDACGHEFELLVMGSEVPACPQCESEKLEKRFSTFAPGSSASSSVPEGCPYPTGGG